MSAYTHKTTATQPIHVIITIFYYYYVKKSSNQSGAQKESDSDLLSTAANTRINGDRDSKSLEKKNTNAIYRHTHTHTHVNFHFIGPIIPRVNGHKMLATDSSCSIFLLVFKSKTATTNTERDRTSSSSLFFPLALLLALPIDHFYGLHRPSIHSHENWQIGRSSRRQKSSVSSTIHLTSASTHMKKTVIRMKMRVFGPGQRLWAIHTCVWLRLCVWHLLLRDTCCSPISIRVGNDVYEWMCIYLYACTHIEQHTLCNRNLHSIGIAQLGDLVSSYTVWARERRGKT